MCGLVGFIPNKNKQINLLRFKSLLIYNEDRGKLSTGIYNIDGVRKDTVKSTEFTKDQKWNKLTKNSIFLGHTRQPTVGYKVTMEGAQPVELDNTVMIHNGSIYNKEALANKYGVTCESEDTDSVIIAKILNTKQYQVLEDYNGAAALLWVHKDEPNRLYVYKGESKRRDSASTIEDERPLYLMDTKEGIYLSSLEDSLENIALHENEVNSITTIEGNKVCYIDTDNVNDLNLLIDINRKSNQEKVIVKEKHHKRNHSRSHKDYGRNYNFSYADDDYDNDYYGCGYKPKSTNNSTIITTDDADPYSLKGAIKCLNTEDKYLGPVMEKFNVSDNDIVDEYVNRTYIPSGSIYFNKGRYWHDGILCRGFYTIDEAGKISRADTVVSFINGILLNTDGEKHYARILSIINDRSLEFGTEEYAEFLSNYSNQPIPYFDSFSCSILFYSDGNPEYSGRYFPKFINRGAYLFSSGYFIIASSEFSIDTVRKGDLVLLKDDTQILVTTTSFSGFWGIAANTSFSKYSTYGEVKSFIPGETKNESIDVVIDIDDIESDGPGDEDTDDFDAMDDIVSIVSELNDCLLDTIDQLKLCDNKELTQPLIEAISKFKENNIVL